MNKPPKDFKIQRPFKYVPASATDISKTIREARKAIEAANKPQPSAVIRQIKRQREAA